ADIVGHREIGIAATVEGRRRVARARRQAVAELVHDDDEILARVERPPFADLPFEVGVLRAERRRIDDDVRLGGVERAVGLIGQPCAAIGQPGLQNDVAGLENAVVGHRGSPHLFHSAKRYFTSRATPLRKISTPTSHPNLRGSSLRITLSPSQEPTTTSGRPMAIRTALDPSYNPSRA